VEEDWKLMDLPFVALPEKTTGADSFVSAPVIRFLLLVGFSQDTPPG
jgi:hypothetical protein